MIYSDCIYNRTEFKRFRIQISCNNQCCKLGCEWKQYDWWHKILICGQHTKKIALDMDPIVLDRFLKRSWLNCYYVNARGKWIYCSQTRRHSGHSSWHLSSTNNYLHWTRRRNCRWILIGDRAINNFSNVQIARMMVCPTQYCVFANEEGHKTITSGRLAGVFLPKKWNYDERRYKRATKLNISILPKRKSLACVVIVRFMCNIWHRALMMRACRRIE